MGLSACHETYEATTVAYHCCCVVNENGYHPASRVYRRRKTADTT
jgi:hypothetical protein